MPPEPERPGIDADYGISPDPDGLLPWSFAGGELERARNYWIVTARPDGRPHAMPVWGVWLDETLWFSTGEASVKARNLAADPRLVVHLESGDDAVILEGVAERPALDSDRHGRIVAAYASKYDMAPDDLPGPDGWYRLRAEKALGWRESDFPGTATRWRLDPGGRSA
jgi:PPOX class probable F420-dependent enzyme